MHDGLTKLSCRAREYSLRFCLVLTLDLGLMTRRYYPCTDLLGHS